MRTLPAITLILVAAPALWSAPVPKGKPPEVELRPLATELFVGEPFEAFVRFTNRGKEEVLLFQEWYLSQHVGNVGLEVKGPRDKEFRCPYVAIRPRLRDGPRTPPEKGVKAGERRCEFVTLPWHDAGLESASGRFEEAGEWQVRGKVELHNKEEKVSPPVTVRVSERTAAEAKRVADIETALWRPRTTKDSFGDEFKARLKLVDDLGPCYTADVWRRRNLGFRLSVAGTAQSKETADQVMKDIDAYLKSVSGPVHDRFCWALVDSAYRRVADDVYSASFDRTSGNPQDIAVGRKYLKLVDCVPDNWEGMDKLFDEAERKLKAKSPEKKK